jgi:hypothetical protein
LCSWHPDVGFRSATATHGAPTFSSSSGGRRFALRIRDTRHVCNARCRCSIDGLQGKERLDGGRKRSRLLLQR